VALTFSRTGNLTPKSGDMFQIVGVGKGNTLLGCRLMVNGNIVAEQPLGGLGQCVYNPP
jgi:hypothetical protein